MNEVELHFGALADMLEDQLRQQGLSFKEDIDSKMYQGHADAITRLNISGVLTDGETNKARERLFKKISKSIKEV